jgi:hypothetical protein
MRQFRGLLLTGNACAIAVIVIGVALFMRSGDPPKAAAQPPQATEKKEAKATVAADPEFFDEKFLPFLKQHCFKCHEGEEPESELRLDQHKSLDALKGDRKRWMKVVRMLKTRQMPPEDEKQPPVALADSMAGWLDHSLNYIDCNAPRDPGYVTIRRLNRIEYRNTVRELIGVNYELPDDFPADDVGYGFDNIGDVLTLPPILMEKYLAAAEQVTDQMLAELAPEGGQIVALRGDRLQTDGNGRRNGDVHWLNSNGDVRTRHSFADSGEYTIRVHAEGDQAGPERVKMALSIDGRQLQVFEIKSHGKIEQHDHSLRIEKGSHSFAVRFLNDYYQPNNPNPADRDRNMAVHQIEVIGPKRDRAARESQVAKRVFFVQPNDKVKPQQAAEQILRRVASRAFRRPATDDEVARLVELGKAIHQRKGDFQQALAVTLRAILVSPNFLFKVELDPAPGEKTRLLSEYELATRMSYFLWSTMPDDELLKQAHAGTLRKNLQTQIRRMLADPRARALGENFATQWLGLRNLAMMQPDKGRFPMFSDELRDSMYGESVLFFDAIVREDRSVSELLGANFTFVDERLAKHYGIGPVSGDGFQRVALDGKQPRGSVLTQAGVLTVTSNPTRTSPVKRGKWVLENILGEPPPDPPADVPELEETEKARDSASLRERLEVHRKSAKCSVCHEQMDALGFAMENFDAVGAWRDKDGRFEIDASGKLPDGGSFTGPADLKQLLKTKYRAQFVRCIAEKMLTYAVGRGVEYYDRCVIDDICNAAAKNDHRFSSLVIEIIKSDAFQRRRAK